MTCAKKINSFNDFDKGNIQIVTDRLVLKVLRPQDITPQYVFGLNDEEVNYYLLEVKRNRQTFESVKSFVLDNAGAANSLLLGIFLKDLNELIGTIRLTGISFFHYYSGIGICIFAKQYWGKGYALESLLRIKEFVFNEMGMHFLEAGMYGQNASSVKLFEKAGFECYLKISDKYRLEDKFADVLMFKAVNPDFNLEFRKDKNGEFSKEKDTGCRSTSR